MKTYPMTVKDGHVYANITLRDVLERTDVSDMPMLSEVKRLYDENDKLRELAREMWACISHIGEYDVFYYDMAEDGCGMGCTVNGEHCCANKMYDRMREQGIEVY